jgi:hypothetical protein
MEPEGSLPCTQELANGRILSQINPADILTIYLRSILILSFHPRLGLPSGILLSGFPSNILYAFQVFHKCYMPRPCNQTWFHHTNKRGVSIF